MKNILLLSLAIILAFSLMGCANNVPTNSEPQQEPQESLPQEAQPEQAEEKNPLDFDFKSEEDILKYLVGQWEHFSLGFSPEESSLTIYDNLNLSISIGKKGENSEEYTGSIEILEDMESLLFKIDGESYTYNFKHKTFYDGCYLMGLYHSGESNHILGDLVKGYEMHMIDEVLFQRATSIEYSPQAIKNSSFLGAIWGYEVEDGRDKLWIGELDKDFKFTDGISQLYGFSQEIDDETMSIYYDNLFTTYVYILETDENGDIISLSMEGNLHNLSESEDQGPVGYWMDSLGLVQIRQEGEDYSIYYYQDEWEAIHFISDSIERHHGDEVVLLEDFTPIEGFNGRVKDLVLINMDEYTQGALEDNYPQAFFLMENGTVEWMPTYPFIDKDIQVGERSQSTISPLPWLKDIVEIKLEMDYEGIGGEATYAIDSDGKSYNIKHPYMLYQMDKVEWKGNGPEIDSQYDLFNIVSS